MPLTISIFSDVVCPWCYVGKRRLETALDQLGLRSETRLEWLPFELNPDMPENGMLRSEYRARKFGSERSAELDARMAETGREENIAFAFNRMARTPNTRRAHMLIAQAQQSSLGDAMVEALFRGYFESGEDLGDEEILVRLAETVGLDREAARACLRDEALRERVVATEQQAHKLGVSGVPFFIVDQRWAVSGAQPASDWIQAFRGRAHAKPVAA